MPIRIDPRSVPSASPAVGKIEVLVIQQDLLDKSSRERQWLPWDRCPEKPQLQQDTEKLADSRRNGVLTPLSSFPRKQESSVFQGFWIPALPPAFAEV
jgi:hypothetical protein